MVVSMIQLIIEIPDISSIKEKRRIVRSIKDRMQTRFRLSAAEVDLQDSLRYSQLGGAFVSNSRSFGESIMHKVLSFVEDELPGRIQDVRITSEVY